MNSSPLNQIQLYGLKNEFKELTNLYSTGNFPNKILLSGQKGCGKCTLAYHLINFVLSMNEDYSYDSENLKINEKSKQFILINNRTNPNLHYIDVLPDKKNIEIKQIRNLINELNKSSFNSKPRFVIIDNLETLNINSINALLKILEEPSQNIFFILIHNNKKILPTLKSRCLIFKINLSNSESINVINKLINDNIHSILNKDLINYYASPGDIVNLLNYLRKSNLDAKNLRLKDFLVFLINDSNYKKDSNTKTILYNFIEYFLNKNLSIKYIDYFNYFITKINNIKKFNLDEESFLIEFKSKILNE